MSPDRERLLELASLHRERGDETAEVRALLRALALNTGDKGVLGRLRTLFADTGDANRLLTVLLLELETCQAPEERRQLMLELAAIARAVPGDDGLSASYIELMLAENLHDPDATLEAMGAMLALKGPQQGVEQLRAFVDASRTREEPSDSGEDALRALRTALRVVDVMPTNGAAP